MYLCAELVVRRVFMNLPDGYFLQKKKYQLTHTIGQGGFGITYLGVWNTEVKGELGAMKTKVPVCIKEYFFKDYCYRDQKSYAVKVHSETGERLFGKFKEKLIEEANILSAVHHPYIVNVLEVFEENDTAYIVMEYIKGCSLKYMLDKEGVLAENKVLKYTHQIGNALDFVHNKNIVHLDIKPGNILIDRDDNARLIDFGVSKRYDIEEQETSTTTLTLSKGFASIEQYDDEGTQNFSPCPDIYSLGATMYNLLTGVIPVESILRATKEMLPPSSYNSNVTQKTEKAILKAMEVKPGDRFQKVKEMLAAIDIPPYELAENTLVETKQSVEDDNTEILSAHLARFPDDNDDDRTIVSSSGGQITETNTSSGNKIKRKILLSVAILLCAFIGYAVYSYFSDATTSGVTYAGLDMPGDSLTPKLNVIKEDVAVANQSDSLQQSEQGQLQQQTGQQVTIPPTNNIQRQVNPESGIVSNAQPETTSSQGNAEPVVSHLSLTIEEKATYEREYQLFLSSGKAKMEPPKRDYSGALEDFMKALDLVETTGIKSTLEVDHFIRTCREKLDEQKRKERLAKYETYNTRNLGDLKIARDKKTGLFGAIDASGEERIPCKYITVNKPLNGGLPEFLREDNLVDIYDEEGKSKGTGLQPSN